MSQRSWALRASLLAAAAALGLGIACLIPDRGVIVLSSDFNLNPVRFVERIPLETETLCACDATNCQCPLPEPTGLPTYLDPELAEYQFCICEGDRVDENSLGNFVLYAEDQDQFEDGSPQDLLYAAALLDWDQTLEASPFDFIAYRAYLDPQQELALAPVSPYENPIKRPRPYVRQLPLGNPDGRFDLCNEAGRTLTPGVHTLSFIVTDRSWTERTPEDSMVDGTDEPLVSTVTLEGVPDIAAGATFDIRTYVFTCLAEQDEDCQCADLQDP